MTSINEKGSTEHIDNLKSADDVDMSEAALVEAAVAYCEEETKLKLRQLFKLYTPAAAWSMLLSAALIMEGMDVGLINNFFGQQAYINRFGHTRANGTKFIPANWQAAINNGNAVGSIIGLLINGYCQSRYGSRRTYMCAQVSMAATIFLLVFAKNLEMLFAGNILAGIPWGIFQTLSTAYAAEICPPAMRGFLTSWVSMCWGSGSFLAAGILRASLGLPGDWAWRVPYMLQWIWPVPLFFVAYFAPESPYFLVRQERYEEAEKVLVRLARKDHYTPLQLRQQIALMKHTNEMEKRDAKTGSYADCFRGVNKRRTEIACVAFLTQIWSGQAICSYATVFLRAAGMAQTMAFNYSMAIQSTNILTTGIAISLMGRVGRRTFYLCGLTAIGLSMMGIGIVGFVSKSSSASIAVAVLMILVNASFKTSIGPTCYPIVSEMPSGRTRAQSIVLARSTYVVGNIILNQLVPRQLSVDAWNWGAKCGLFWMAFDVCFIVYHYFRLPETSKRTFGELEYLFQKGVPARQFKNYHIDVADLAQDAHGLDRATSILEEKRDDTKIDVVETATVQALGPK